MFKLELLSTLNHCSTSRQTKQHFSVKRYQHSFYSQNIDRRIRQIGQVKTRTELQREISTKCQSHSDGTKKADKGDVQGQR